MSRRPSADSTKSTSSGTSKKGGKVGKGDASGDFVWDKYLQQTGMSAAPAECFKQQVFDDPHPNKFQMSDKLEAKDTRNPSAISVATVVQIQGPRICLRLDGTDGCNDFWHLIDSKDIFPLGTCEAHGGLLQPPLGYTRNVSTWPNFLLRTLRKANRPNSDCFYQEPEKPSENFFEIGMKLEAVDKKNPQLICPATIGDVDQDQVFVSFDGWRGAVDYWCSYDSRDLFPVGWCQSNNHLIQGPGKKGDNPVVIEKLKLVAEQRKRQTRSVKNLLEQKQPNKDLSVIQTKEKPIRRRRVDSIKATRLEEDDKNDEKSDIDDLPAPNTSTSVQSDASASSDESDSAPESIEDKPEQLASAEDGDTTSSGQSSSSQSKDSPSQAQFSDQELRKLERRERKQKRKLARVLKRAGIAEEQIGELKTDGIAVSLNLTPEQVTLLTSPRKRLHVSESDLFKFKKKKKKRNLLQPSYTRMEGFGIKGSELSSSTASSSLSPTSPSFLDVMSSSPPTSLFGVDKSQIVRNATQGWPTRPQLGSVVTSDNKLGRFDKITVPERKPDSEPTKIEDSLSEPVTPQCVSTTSNDSDILTSSMGIPRTPGRTPSPSVSSTTPPETSEDSSNVSSTTNSSPSCSTSFNHSSSTQVAATFNVTSTVMSTPTNSNRRSRNPKKWSIDDVISYVREKEPALHPHLFVFQKHEIDGRAFLLLNSNNIVKYMGLKLGPALKLCSLVENLKTAIEKYRRKRKPGV